MLWRAAAEAIAGSSPRIQRVSFLERFQGNIVPKVILVPIRSISATPWSGRCTGLLNQAGDQRQAMAKVSKSVTDGLLGIMDPSQEAPQEQA